MENKKVSQYKLLQSGIDNKTLDRLKKNQNITLATLEKLCNILECTPNDIAYQMKYDDLVFDQDKKYTDLARVKEEIREVDRRLRQEIIISNSTSIFIIFRCQLCNYILHKTHLQIQFFSPDGA